MYSPQEGGSREVTSSVPTSATLLEKKDNDEKSEKQTLPDIVPDLSVEQKSEATCEESQIAITGAQYSPTAELEKKKRPGCFLLPK